MTVPASAPAPAASAGRRPARPAIWLLALFALLLAACDRPNEEILTDLLQEALRQDIARLSQEAMQSGGRTLDPRWIMVKDMRIEWTNYVDNYWAVMTSFTVENGPFRRSFGAILRVTKRGGQWHLINVERRWIGD